jgi:hypothetical protein
MLVQVLIKVMAACVAITEVTVYQAVAAGINSLYVLLPLVFKRRKPQ